ncbi:DUF5329 domain-containing protein [Pseudoxanthomonas helianthi]|uniref:DUF5329 domain-containing protein n=1 Tax=Pseudoxanthomonas helianthi TaxID=1453541 RepID=A0A940X614_9GAMM|nr:DUF5329 domain-containing protein [Pseudoxanthomonas helianthi]MBP3985039.1 DUF5329 domain-containing protein [Pseudoxanthomonas helianthi]
MRLRFSTAAIALLLASAPAFAAPSAKARQEIAGLMQALGASHCEFNRNGSWYDATQARAHLQRKCDYLLKKDLVDSAEQFIDRAASRSSFSGKAYRVRCPGRPEQDAAGWFRDQLQRLRGSAKPAP